MCSISYLISFLCARSCDLSMRNVTLSRRRTTQLHDIHVTFFLFCGTFRKALHGLSFVLYVVTIIGLYEPSLDSSIY